MSDILLSPREVVQNAIGRKMRDFRQWSSPHGIRDLRNWKTRQLAASIIVAKSKMVDNAEEMLRKIAETDNAGAIGDDGNSGTSIYLPVMIIALAATQNPPEQDVVIGRSDWLAGVIASDPLGRVVQIRCTPVAYRCQVAFFASNDHAVESISNQFCSFFRSEQKRAFKVNYDLGYAGDHIVRDAWDFRVIENTLYPDTADVGIPNVSAVTIDFIIVGNEPTVVGLGHPDDDITDTGEPDGSIPPGLPPVTGGRLPDEALNAVVTQADVIDEGANSRTRLNADQETGVITQIHLNMDGSEL